MAKGNLAGASKAFTHAFQIDAQYVEAHRGMAELHFIEKKPVEALGELEKALLIEPLHGEVFTLYERTIDTELSLAERVQYRSSLSYRVGR